MLTFTHDAVVVDQGEAFRGVDRVLDFLRNAGASSRSPPSSSPPDAGDTHWGVVNRIEGDFPGHVADLDYGFTLAGDLVRELHPLRRRSDQEERWM